MYHNIIKITVSSIYYCTHEDPAKILTSSLVIDSRAISRASVRSRAKMPRQNQKPLQEPESKLSLNAARARSNLSQSQCCQKPGIARAKCSYKKSIRLSCSQTKDLDTRVFTVLSITSNEPKKVFFSFLEELAKQIFSSEFFPRISITFLQKSKNANHFSRSIRKAKIKAAVLLSTS